jgi:hypothetical protein
MKPRSAREWREFWSERGMRELNLLLWGAWDPIGAGVPLDEYAGYVPRIASLLGSRASRDAIANELERIARESMALDLEADVHREAAAKIIDWFESV